MSQSTRDRIARLEEPLVAAQEEVSPSLKNHLGKILNEEPTPRAADAEPLFDVTEGQVSISDIKIVPLLDVQVTHTRHVDEMASEDYLANHQPGMTSWQNLSAAKRKTYIDATLEECDLTLTLHYVGYKIGFEARTQSERAAVSMGLAAGMRARRELATKED